MKTNILVYRIIFGRIRIQRADLKKSEKYPDLVLYGPDPPTLGLKAMYLLSLPKLHLSSLPLLHTGIYYVLFLRKYFCLNFFIFTFHTYFLDFVLSCLSSTLENLVFIRLSYVPGICGFVYSSLLAWLMVYLPLL